MGRKRKYPIGIPVQAVRKIDHKNRRVIITKKLDGGELIQLTPEQKMALKVGESLTPEQKKQILEGSKLKTRVNDGLQSVSGAGFMIPGDTSKRLSKEKMETLNAFLGGSDKSNINARDITELAKSLDITKLAGMVKK